MKIMDMKTMETKGRHKMERKRDREKKKEDMEGGMNYSSFVIFTWL